MQRGGFATLNALALADTFVHIETLPGVVIFKVKIQVVKCFPLIPGTLPNSFPTVGYGLPENLFPEMIWQTVSSVFQSQSGCSELSPTGPPPCDDLRPECMRFLWSRKCCGGDPRLSGGKQSVHCSRKVIQVSTLHLPLPPPHSQRSLELSLCPSAAHLFPLPFGYCPFTATVLTNVSMTSMLQNTWIFFSSPPIWPISRSFHCCQFLLFLLSMTPHCPKFSFYLSCYFLNFYSFSSSSSSHLSR